jgi:hypothetical protein
MDINQPHKSNVCETLNVCACAKLCSENILENKMEKVFTKVEAPFFQSSLGSSTNERFTSISKGHSSSV